MQEGTCSALLPRATHKSGKGVPQLAECQRVRSARSEADGTLFVLPVRQDEALMPARLTLFSGARKSAPETIARALMSRSPR